MEAKATHVFAVAIAETDELDTPLEKFSYSKVKRICSWIMQFIRNARSAKMRWLTGPLSTEETNKANAFWVKRVQTKAPLNKYYQEDQLQLNLKPNSEGVLECRGRIQGHYPVYLPVSRRYTEKFVTQAHLATLRGGVVSTMAKVREQYWVPRLRRLTKRVVKNCLGCRRFQVKLSRLRSKEPSQKIGQTGKLLSKSLALITRARWSIEKERKQRVYLAVRL